MLKLQHRAVKSRHKQEGGRDKMTLRRVEKRKREDEMREKTFKQYVLCGIFSSQRQNNNSNKMDKTGNRENIKQ